MDVPYINNHLIDVFQREIGFEKSEWVLGHFSGKKATKEMFAFLWDFEDAHRYMTPALVPSGKSDSKADKLRAEGDNYYTQNNLDKALELYNLSIMAATHPHLMLEQNRDQMNNNDYSALDKEHKALALGYACRSAVLFDLDEYQKSLCDIDRALKCGYPESAQMKLEERKLSCLAAMDSKETVMNGETKEEDDVDYNDICSMMEKCGKVPSEDLTSKEILQSSQERRQLPKLMAPHPNMPALSNALNLAYTSSKGRHLIADRDIQPGEVVGTEKSYCNGLYCTEFNTHCNTCLMESLTPVPCPNCSLVIFCSEECRDKGLSENHGRECDILPTLATIERKENTVTYIAFKLILQTTYKGLRDKLAILQKEAEEEDPMNLGFDDSGLYSSTDYRPVYHLVGNKDQRPSKELFETCVTAFVLTKLLVEGDVFFKDNNGQSFAPTRDDFVMVGDAFVHHLLNIYCNAFQLSNMKLTSAPAPIKPVLKVFGEGVFPVLSLFNHSCNPTVRHYNHGERLVLQAVRFIPAGEEVTTTYCGSFYIEDLETRREYLQGSYIDCTCDACLGKWPITSELPVAMAIKCTSCGTPVRSIRCRSCRLDYESIPSDEEKTLQVEQWWTLKAYLEGAQEKVQYILLRKKVGQPVLTEDVSVLNGFIEEVWRSVQLPCQPFCYAMDTLFLIFCLQFCSPENT